MSRAHTFSPLHITYLALVFFLSLLFVRSLNNNNNNNNNGRALCLRRFLGNAIRSALGHDTTRSASMRRCLVIRQKRKKKGFSRHLTKRATAWPTAFRPGGTKVKPQGSSAFCSPLCSFVSYRAILLSLGVQSFYLVLERKNKPHPSGPCWSR